MDFEPLKLLLIPFITGLFQALKGFSWIKNHEDDVPFMSLLTGIILTELWTLAYVAIPEAATWQFWLSTILVALLEGSLMGLSSVGLYEVTARAATRLNGN